MANEVMTICPHGDKYENCVYGCKLWSYTRNNRKHYIDDGVVYASGPHWYLWEIYSSAPYGNIQAKHGYDIYHKGKKIKHGKTVKELKQFVEQEYHG